MKKALIGLVGLFLVVLALQNVAAYISYDYTPYSNAYHGGIYVLGQPSPNDYYDLYPTIYRKVKYSGTAKDPVVKWVSNGDGFEDKLKRARAVLWTAESYDWRYNYAGGLPSGYVFGGDETKAESGSNWRYKEAYDPRAYGPGNTYMQEYYYEPRYDYQSGTFNWRY